MAVIIRKLGRMEKILNGAEPDSAMNLQGVLTVRSNTLTLAYVNSSGNENPILWQEETVSTI